MAKKRTADESENNEETKNDDSHLEIQCGYNAKRAKLASLDDATMEDLPNEMVEYILVRAVAKEVQSMKVAKVIWKEKADLVINRLKTICSQWTSILTTNFFRDKIHRVLDGTGQEPLQLEILHQFLIKPFVFKVTTLKDEIFMLCYTTGEIDGKHYVIKVGGRNNATMEMTDVIPLPGIRRVWAMTACRLSNCVYVLTYDWDSRLGSVLRVERDGEHWFYVAVWIPDLQLSVPFLSVSTNGNIVVATQMGAPPLPAVSIYDPSGFFLHTVMLSKIINSDHWLHNVVQKPNGNLVLLSSGLTGGTHLTEIDLEGGLVRKFHTKLYPDFSAAFTDIYGRIWMTDWRNTVEVVDSELNLIEAAGPLLLDAQCPYSCQLHYDWERNEIVRISGAGGDAKKCLTVFRFKETEPL